MSLANIQRYRLHLTVMAVGIPVLLVPPTILDTPTTTASAATSAARAPGISDWTRPMPPAIESGATKTAPSAPPAAQPRPHKIAMTVTAYCPCERCCGESADALTASGKSVRYNGGRFVAADPNVLAFFKKVSVPGYWKGRPVPVIDRGRMIRGNRLDVFFDSHAQAQKWGTRKLNVSIMP